MVPPCRQCHFQLPEPHRRLVNTLSLPAHKFICKMKIFSSDKRHTSRPEFSQPVLARQVARELLSILFSYNWFIWFHIQNGGKSITLNFVLVVKNSKTETRLKWMLMPYFIWLFEEITSSVFLRPFLTTLRLFFLCGDPYPSQSFALWFCVVTVHMLHLTGLLGPWEEKYVF